MRNWKLLVAGAALVGAGCILTSGQILISFDLVNPLTVTNLMPVYSEPIDLSTNSDYVEHKDKLETLADVALLGQVTNNSGTAVDAEVYFSETSNTFMTPAEVRAGAKKLWGPFALAPNETKTISWDQSAALIDDAGRDALIAEVKGDGVFTLYIIGTTGTFSFTVNNPVLVLVLDAGV
jgi:hypothetical protein